MNFLKNLQPFIESASIKLVLYTFLGENITVLGSRQFFDERILWLGFFNTIYYISVLGMKTTVYFTSNIRCVTTN